MKIFVVALLLLMIFAVSGCGNGGPAPDGSAITVEPAAPTPVADNSDNITTHTQSFTISVINSSGFSVGNTDITVSFPYAAPDNSSYVQFYDGNTPVNSPFNTKTNGDGIYTLRFDYKSGSGLNYAGDLQVTSGPASASVPFSVTGTGSSTISSIQITPPSFLRHDNSTTITTRTTYLYIVTQNATGGPMANQGIIISYPYAVPDNGTGYVQFYNKDNVSVNSPFTAVTDNSGLYTLRVDYRSGGGLSYSEDLQVVSGSGTLSNTATFGVDTAAP
jgi:hypothetical protein